MKAITAFLCVTALLATSIHAEDKSIPNRLIDYPSFMKSAAEVARLRAEHRVTEPEFIHMAAESGTIVLDARSDAKFSMLHVKGARHLSFPDITAEELAKVIPAKSSRVLIYCNNNFENEPRAFPSKMPAASLNIHTFNTLFNYGYRNIFELGPLVDIKKTKLPLEGTLVRAK
jgi:hypothetical protein